MYSYFSQWYDAVIFNEERTEIRSLFTCTDRGRYMQTYVTRDGLLAYDIRHRHAWFGSNLGSVMRFRRPGTSSFDSVYLFAPASRTQTKFDQKCSSIPPMAPSRFITQTAAQSVSKIHGCFFLASSCSSSVILGRLSMIRISSADLPTNSVLTRRHAMSRSG